jgi:flagellar protein FlgJ
MTPVNAFNMTGGYSSISTNEILKDGRLNGDYKISFADLLKNERNKSAKPTGAAANSATASSSKELIDKTSKLYEKSLELESFFVKIMLNSMKSTINSGFSGQEQSYASKMYQDMMYDEYATVMTKNAGFGLADQIYLSLSGK